MLTHSIVTGRLFESELPSKVGAPIGDVLLNGSVMLASLLRLCALLSMLLCLRARKALMHDVMCSEASEGEVKYTVASEGLTLTISPGSGTRIPNFTSGTYQRSGW